MSPVDSGAETSDQVTNTDGGKVWFITGTSRGFGREWAIAALDRGDRVAATARNLDTLADLVDTIRRDKTYSSKLWAHIDSRPDLRDGYQYPRHT